MDFAPYKAVLFDLDGVITPTAQIHQVAWREVFDEVLPQLAPEGEKTYADDDYVLYVDGKPRYDGVASVLTAHGVELPWGDPADKPGVNSICAIGNMKNDVFARVLERDRIEPYPGAITVIDHLDELGIPSAIVSSSRNARKVLDVAGITDRFTTIVDGKVISDEGLAGKPDPAPFLAAAERLAVEPDVAVVVEDAISGVRAGASGHFGLVIGVDREKQEEALLTAGADIVVPDVGDLLRSAG